MTLSQSNTGGGASQVNPSIASKAGLPSWEETILNDLSSSGQLNGVNPNDLIGIQYAEEGPGGNSYGSARSSTGAGGFFGLSANENYTFGGSTYNLTSGQLSNTGASGYTAQAETASAAFANALKASGGNPLGAESYYQTGHTSYNPNNPPEGVAMFQELGITGNQGTGSLSPSSGGSSSSSPSNTPNNNSSLANGIFGVFGGPSIASVAIFFVALVAILIGGLLLVGGTIKGANKQGVPAVVPV